MSINVTYYTITEMVKYQKAGISFARCSGWNWKKTFVKNLMLSKLIKEYGIALVALSVIAFTLLPRDRIFHAAFKLPHGLHTNENPVLNISKTSGMVEVIRQCHLIVFMNPL